MVTFVPPSVCPSARLLFCLAVGRITSIAGNPHHQPPKPPTPQTPQTPPTKTKQAGRLEEALALLDAEQKFVVDGLSWRVHRAKLLALLGRRAEATEGALLLRWCCVGACCFCLEFGVWGLWCRAHAGGRVHATRPPRVIQTNAKQTNTQIHPQRTARWWTRTRRTTGSTRACRRRRWSWTPRRRPRRWRGRR